MPPLACGMKVSSWQQEKRAGRGFRNVGDLLSIDAMQPLLALLIADHDEWSPGVGECTTLARWQRVYGGGSDGGASEAFFA